MVPVSSVYRASGENFSISPVCFHGVSPIEEYNHSTQEILEKTNQTPQQILESSYQSLRQTLAQELLEPIKNSP